MWNSPGRRPYTGARIETQYLSGVAIATIVAPTQGRGLKHSDAAVGFEVFGSPLHRGAD